MMFIAAQVTNHDVHIHIILYFHVVTSMLEPPDAELAVAPPVEYGLARTAWESSEAAAAMKCENEARSPARQQGNLSKVTTVTRWLQLARCKLNNGGCSGIK